MSIESDVQQIKTTVAEIANKVEKNNELFAAGGVQNPDLAVLKTNLESYTDSKVSGQMSGNAATATKASDVDLGNGLTAKGQGFFNKLVQLNVENVSADTLVNPGSYLVTYPKFANNFPVEWNGVFMLEVIELPGQFIIQYLSDYPKNYVYYRSRSNNTWGSWICTRYISHFNDDAAATHNLVYRGANLTNQYTLSALSTKLTNGDFSDLFIGDYIQYPFTYNGTTKIVTFRFAHFNYWKYMGDTSCTRNHIVLVPDVYLYTEQMNETNDTTGGIVASKVWTQLQGDVYTAINAASCMNGHVLTHRDWIPDTVNKELTSSAGAGFLGSTTYTATMWRDVKLGLMKEPMVYGTTVFGSSGYDVGCGKSQLALFRIDPTWITSRGSRAYFWLGAVASGSGFALANGHGVAIYDGASAVPGVRPYFLFA